MEIQSVGPRTLGVVGNPSPRHLDVNDWSVGTISEITELWVSMTSTWAIFGGRIRLPS